MFYLEEAADRSAAEASAALQGLPPDPPPSPNSSLISPSARFEEKTRSSEGSRSMHSTRDTGRHENRNVELCNGYRVQIQNYRLEIVYVCRKRHGVRKGEIGLIQQFPSLPFFKKPINFEPVESLLLVTNCPVTRCNNFLISVPGVAKNLLPFSSAIGPFDGLHLVYS